MENPEDQTADKLIPEWGRDSDDQVLLAGLAVAAIFFGLLGYNLFFGSDDSVAAADTAAVTVVESAEDTDDTAATVASSVGDVQASVDDFPGDITGTASGATAVLTGFVANDSERDEAETAALTVEGIDSVDNQLEILEPEVTGVLTDANVRTPSAQGVGTVITATGTVISENQRDTALASAAAVPGVTEVIDELVIEEEEEAPDEEPDIAPITDQLNSLPQVQFENASATILPDSFGDLDAAAALLQQVDEGFTGTIEVQGYTDTSGAAAANQTLSERRADAVRTYLVDKGASDTLLGAQGYGPTTQFGPELADNRLVRFEAIT